MIGNKSFIIIALLVALLSITSVVSGETTMVTTTSYIDAPNPVGQGQTIEIALKISPLPPLYNDTFHGLQYKITRPDGSTEAGGMFNADSNGEYRFNYTTKLSGNYTIEFSYPGETFASTGITYSQSVAPSTIIQVFKSWELDTARNLAIAVFIALIADAALIVGAKLLLRKKNIFGFRDLIRDADLWPSLVRLQFLAWTLVVVFCFLTITITRILSGVSALTPDIPENLLFLFGISAGVTPIAILISKSKYGYVTPKKNDDKDTSNGTVQKTETDKVAEEVKQKESTKKDRKEIEDTKSEKPFSSIIEEDGQPSLTRFQMLAWTVVGIASYLFIFSGQLADFLIIGPIGNNTISQLLVLPDIDITLVVLMGLSQGAYLGGKSVVPKKPTIFSISPNPATEYSEVFLNGINFGAEKSAIKIGNKTISSSEIVSWGDSSIILKIPCLGLKSSEEEYTLTLLIGGKEYNSKKKLKIQKSSVPTISPNPATEGGKVNIGGISFGSDKSVVKVGDKTIAANEIDWLSTGVTFNVPMLSELSTNETSEHDVKLIIDGKMYCTPEKLKITKAPCPSPQPVVELHTKKVKPKQQGVIVGKHFGVNQGSVFIDGTPAIVVNWEDGKVTYSVPETIEPNEYDLVIRTKDKILSAPVKLKVAPSEKAKDQ